MRELELFGRLLIAGASIAFLVCVLYLCDRRPRRFNTDDPVYTPEELRRMEIHEETHKD
jgi:hypothetical protein